MEVAKATETVWAEAERWVDDQMKAEEAACRRMERKMGRQDRRQGLEGDRLLLDEVGFRSKS